MCSLFAPSASLGQNGSDNDLSERHRIMLTVSCKVERTVNSIEEYCLNKNAFQ